MEHSKTDFEMIRGDSSGTLSEFPPVPVGTFDSCDDGDQEVPSSKVAETNHNLSKRTQRSFSSASYKSFEPLKTNSERYGAYESFESESPAVEGDLFGCSYSDYKGCYDDGLSQIWADEGSARWDCLFRRPSERTAFSDSGRGSAHSSLSDLSTPSSSFMTSHARHAPIGSRGRATATYFLSQYGGRRHEPLASAIVRGRGFCRPSPDIDYHQSRTTSPAFRGMKRKMMAPVQPTEFFKKQRIVRLDAQSDSNSAASKGHCNLVKKKDTETEVTQRRVEVKREKQRRRREKNNEKYGDMHRLDFTCTFCKFRTFEDKDIEKHFGGSYHRETLDYIRKHAKFDDCVISFLHDSMVHKFQKVADRKRQKRLVCSQSVDEDQRVMEGVTEEDYMRKMEIVHCMICDTYIPAVFSPVQQHHKSLVHRNNKELFMEQMKRDSVLTAHSIINSPGVKARYEKYIKGEDPFQKAFAKEQVLAKTQKEEEDVYGELEEYQQDAEP